MLDLQELETEYNNYVSNIPKGVKIIADNLRGKDLNSAFELIEAFTEGVVWISKVHEIFKEHNITLDLDMEQFNGFLIEINKSLENKDLFLAADIFEYEISNLFE